MNIRRDYYLDQLISKKHNRLIKIVSGIRRCGKSYLLFELFKQHLLEEGVAEDHIITIALDGRDERMFQDPDICNGYILSRMQDNEMYYLLLDEVQLMEDFESVLNGLLRKKNLDIYVTGSNSRFLTTDVVTEFRGRGDELRMYPLSFAEFYSTKDCYWQEAWDEYTLYGGMPYTLFFSDPRQKMQYLGKLFEETYLRDIIERNNLKRNAELDELVNLISSNIGCLLNPNRIANIFASVKRVNISPFTINQYINCLQDAFIIRKAERFDIKGNQYINTPFKYYFVDAGLRNARIKFRQSEETHIMENIIYNELVMKGFLVDVGMVEIDKKSSESSRIRKSVEIDFVANMGSHRYYIQSALDLPTPEKREQEIRSLLAVHDAFKKIIITRTGSIPSYDDHGILHVPLKDFLLNQDSILS